MSQPSPPSPSIGKRIVQGGAWVALRFGGSQLAGLVQVIVIARILPPQQIGLLGIATMIITVAGALTQTGFEAAIVQRKELKEHELHVAWTAMCVRGFGLGALLALLAPLLARFFAEPDVGPIVMALAGITAFEGLTSMSVALFKREIEFRKIFWLQSGGQALELAASVVLALALRSVWALVIGRALGACLRVALSYALHPYRPRPRLEREALDSLVSYGKWVTLSSTTTLALQHADLFYVAKALGAEQLAFYQYAYRLSNIPALTINEVLGTLMFPAFVAVRAEPPRLSALFERTVALTILLAVPAAAIIWMLSTELTLALLGPRWLPVAELARLLALFGFARALGAPSVPYFMATNRPALRAKLQLLQLAVFVAAVLPLGARYGARGVALAVTLYGAINLISLAICVRLAKLRLQAVLAPAIQAGIAAAGVVLMVRLVAPRFADASLAGLAVLGLASGVLYLLLLAAVDASMGGKSLKSLREIAAQVAR